MPPVSLRQVTNLSPLKQLKVDITSPKVGLNNSHIVEATPSLDRAQIQWWCRGKLVACQFTEKTVPHPLVLDMVAPAQHNVHRLTI